MARPGEYAEALRCIGLFLDGQYARQIRILHADTVLVVSWQAPSGAQENRRYLPQDLFELSRQAQDLRGSASPEFRIREHLFAVTTPSFLGERPELLRSLRQLLDEQALTLQEIIEQEEGYLVRTCLRSDAQQAQEETYPAETLRQVSAAHQEQRHASPETA
jgi:hypothetical protein